ncbi:hypothetical protein GCM10010300_74110 [Streptomyces olivaceoviridis]|nr:hypothetical protein GCM10010300_74110 [Streptomyces olivaceoviridis]
MTAREAGGEDLHGESDGVGLTRAREGHMSAQLGRGDRPPLRSARLEEAEADELARAAAGYVSYGGAFEAVDPTTVEHHVTTSLFPNWIGCSQVGRCVSWARPSGSPSPLPPGSGVRSARPNSPGTG